MTKIRNGRAVINGKVRDILLPKQDMYVFDFSKYKGITPWPELGEVKVICINAESERMTSSEIEEQEEIKFWQRVIGYETGNSSENATNEYKLINSNFDILQDAKLVYAHKDLENILAQIGVSSLTPFFSASTFGLQTTGETVSMEIAQMKWTRGRTAAFETPVSINGQPYILEVKGVNFGEMPIELGINYFDGGECPGGLPVARMNNSIDILTNLNSNGYDSVILVAAYEIPLTQFDGKSLGAYIRAVKSSPSVSHYDKNLKDVANSLDMSNEELAEYIIRCAAKDMSIIWKLGMTHSWVHEQNMRIGGVSDFTGARYVRDSGFVGIVTDVEMLVASSQKIMRKLIGEEIPYPPDELYQTNPVEAERLADLAYDNSHKDKAEHYFRTREIITSELHKQLGLKLPPTVGTTTLAAEIYSMQRRLGLTNPHEKISIEHFVGFRSKRGIYLPKTLNDLKLPTN